MNILLHINGSRGLLPIEPDWSLASAGGSDRMKKVHQHLFEWESTTLDVMEKL
jgi:hypothetical protein